MGLKLYVNQQLSCVSLMQKTIFFNAYSTFLQVAQSIEQEGDTPSGDILSLSKVTSGKNKPLIPNLKYILFEYYCGVTLTSFS